MTGEDKGPEQKFKYGTKEEAERRYEEKKIEIESIFCPLKGGMCRRACVCCEELKIVNIGTPEAPFWECHGGHCTAYCLVGPV